MNFITGLVDIAKGAWSWFTGGSTLASIAQTALTAWGVSKLSQSTTKENATTTVSQTNTPDPGVRLQVTPDTEHKIPVVYGSAYLGGIITDANITNNNKTMWYAITICEKTGLRMSDGVQSQFTFEDIFWNDQRIIFKTDGITADHSVDRDGNVDYSIQDQVKVYCYNGSSTDGVLPDNYTGTLPPPANTLMPGWSTTSTMNDLIFALIRVDYNKDKGVTGIPTVTFHVTNSMTMPGDSIYDYMTNTRYGAGIDPTEIYSS